MTLNSEWVTAFGILVTILGGIIGWLWMLSRNTDLALEKLREETYKSLERDREACHLSTERLNDRVTANLMLVQGNYVTTAAMESLKADIRNQFNGFRDDMRTMFKNSRTDV